MIGPEPNECVCSIKRVELKVHLCTECRIEQRRREHERVLIKLRGGHRWDIYTTATTTLALWMTVPFSSISFYRMVVVFVVSPAVYVV